MSLSVMLQQLAGGMLVSIEIFFVTLLFSLPLGLLICFGRMSRKKVIRRIVSAYISIMRGTPLMLQLMVVYFGPYFIFGKRNAAFLRRLLEQQLIVTGHAQPRRQLFADFAAAASILSADANYHIVHMNPSSSERRA